MKRLAVYISSVFLLFFCQCRHENVASVSEVRVDVARLFRDLGEPLVQRRAALADSVFSAMHQNGFNGVVLYAEQGRVVYEKAFGWRELRRPTDSLRIDDAFQLSSDSKMFTAEAIMLLRAQGKLDYDDDVRKYIPELPYGGITIRLLLNHRSGLPRYDSMADEFWPDRTKPFSNEAMISMLAEKQPALYAAPDITFFYNNINYALLASVVERVSGQHFEDFMHDNIFEPLGMDHSFIYSMRDDTLVSLYMDCNVHGHYMYRTGAQKAQNEYLNGVMGDKIMFSTVDDIFRFNDALDHCLLLPDSLQREAFVPGSVHWKHDENYGFGWRMNHKHPGAVYHFGWWKGYRSAILRDVERHRLLVVLSNTTRNIPSEILWNFVGDTVFQLPEVSYLLDDKFESDTVDVE